MHARSSARFTSSAHGLYGFKAKAYTGETDLILGQTDLYTDNDLRIEDAQNAETLVLTEWKLVRDARDASDIADKTRVARRQLDRYAGVELAGIELRRHRYAVIVSPQTIELPPTEHLPRADIHNVNVVTAPETARREADRLS